MLHDGSSTSTFNCVPLMTLDYFLIFILKDFIEWHSHCICEKHMATTDSSSVLTLPTKRKHYALNKHNIYCTGKKVFRADPCNSQYWREPFSYSTRRLRFSFRNSPILEGEVQQDNKVLCFPLIVCFSSAL